MTDTVNVPVEVTEANGSLFKAALDMYTVLSWILECYGNDMSEEIKSNAYSILSRARGETQ